MRSLRSQSQRERERERQRERERERERQWPTQLGPYCDYTFFKDKILACAVKQEVNSCRGTLYKLGLKRQDVPGLRHQRFRNKFWLLAETRTKLAHFTSRNSLLLRAKRPRLEQAHVKIEKEPGNIPESQFDHRSETRRRLFDGKPQEINKDVNNAAVRETPFPPVRFMNETQWTPSKLLDCENSFF